MITLDWIILGATGLVFAIGANVFDRILKLVSWIPIVKLVIRLAGGLVFVVGGILLVGTVIAPNVPALAGSTVGSWYVLISDLVWLNW